MKGKRKSRSPNRLFVVYWESPSGRISKEEHKFHKENRKAMIQKIMKRAENRRSRPLVAEYELYQRGKYKGLVKRKLRVGYI